MKHIDTSHIPTMARVKIKIKEKCINVQEERELFVSDSESELLTLELFVYKKLRSF